MREKVTRLASGGELAVTMACWFFRVEGQVTQVIGLEGRTVDRAMGASCREPGDLEARHGQAGIPVCQELPGDHGLEGCRDVDVGCAAWAWVAGGGAQPGGEEGALEDLSPRVAFQERLQARRGIPGLAAPGKSH